MELDKKPDISKYLLFLFYMDLYFFLTSDMNFPGKSGLKVLSQHPKKISKIQDSLNGVQHQYNTFPFKDFLP